MKANDMRALDSKGLQAKLDERGEKAAKSVLVRARLRPGNNRKSSSTGMMCLMTISSSRTTI